MKLAILGAIALLFCGCGEGDTAPTDPAAKYEFPPEGQCTYFNMGQTGPCVRWLELCTLAGQRCTAYIHCNQHQQMGCTK